MHICIHLHELKQLKGTRHTKTNRVTHLTDIGIASGMRMIHVKHLNESRPSRGWDQKNKRNQPF